MYLAFCSFQTQITDLLFKKLGEVEIYLSNKIIGKENEIHQYVITIKEQEDIIQESVNHLRLIDPNWVLQHAAMRNEILHGLSAQKHIFLIA
jgi:hypothetical protein